MHSVVIRKRILNLGREFIQVKDDDNSPVLAVIIPGPSEKAREGWEERKLYQRACFLSDETRLLCHIMIPF